MTMSYQRADDTLESALQAPATPYLWLHIGDPGAAGTSNVAQISAADIDRKAITFGDSPANHAVNTERFVKNTATVEWSGAEIDSAQALTHFSIWGAATADQPEFIGTITDAPKTTGSDGVTVNVGGIEVAIEVYVKPA